MVFAQIVKQKHTKGKPIRVVPTPQLSVRPVDGNPATYLVKEIQND